jgi:alpha-beta hydrolase superfamily lysophospholipase
MRRSFCITTTERHAALGRSLRALWPMALALFVSGCTSLFFFPGRQQVLSPQMMGLASEDITLHSADGTRLFAWHLTASAARGLVCYFHGNAENISTHIVNVAWLPAAGYEVLLVDYRGYGGSAGKAEFPAALDDVQAGIDWCVARGKSQQLPVYALGQSLGAAMVLEVSARAQNREALSAVIADSGFSHYRRIARDVLAQSWLLAPLQYPLSWLVTGKHAPEDAAASLEGLPLLVMHSADDVVVPYAHAQRILANVAGPKCFLATHGPHNAALNPSFPGSDAYQRGVLDFLLAATRRDAFSCPLSVQPAFVPAVK